MKKGAIKTSGILTFIVYTLLFFASLMILGYFLEIEFVVNLFSYDNIFIVIVSNILEVLIIVPTYFIIDLVAVDYQLLEKILSVALVVFCMFMIFWGIKEIIISKREDEAFAKSKRSCGFMMFFKFIIFAFFGAYTTYLIMTYSIDGALLYTLIGFSCFSLLVFLLPSINLATGAKYFKKIENGEEIGSRPKILKRKEVNNLNNEDLQNDFSNAPTVVQANMPPLQNPNQNQQSFILNPQQTDTTNQGIVPGQNGVPANISEKGIADLERLERLRASGALTEENYIAMRNKVINTKIN